MENELDFILNEYNTATTQEAELKEKHAKARARKKLAEEALMDYMTGNGLVEDETANQVVRLKRGTTVVVDDIDALPEEYIRVKREADRAKIRKMRPQANWYREEETLTLEVKNLC